MSLRHSPTRLLTLATVCLLGTGCVKKSTHRVALESLDGARLEIATLQAKVDSLENELAQMRDDMESEQLRRDSIESSLHVAVARVERERDDISAILQQRGADYQALQRRLESLEAVEREVRERNSIYENVIARFQSLMDGGQLSVAIQRGRLVILLPQDVLFESGSATLGREGRAVITEVGGVLAEFTDRSFQVEGHTDNVPIATTRFPSNWELSSARSLAVVRLLTQGGVAPENVSGAAFGEFQPVASNEDRDGRRQNRRIEIVMLPNLDVIAGTDLPVGR